MHAASTAQPSASARPSVDELRAAFRDLHGPSLHGFALLLTAGDRGVAAQLASAALAAGASDVGALRHPERAAAWLRGHVVRHAGRVAVRRARASEGASALADIGAPSSVHQALSGLGVRERAALIASTIERLDSRDVATVVGREGRALDRLVHRAARRYLAAAVASPSPAGTPGPITDRLHRVAERALR